MEPSHTSSRVLTIGFGLYLIALNCALAAAIVFVWASGGAAASGWSAVARFCAAAAVSAGIAASISSATGYADAVGNRRLRLSFALWCCILPFAAMIIGALVASLVTIVFAPPKLQTGFQDFSGVCTLGSILGLMVERAAAKVNWTPAIFGNGRSANHES